MPNIYDSFTYLGRQCPECNFISTEEKPIREISAEEFFAQLYGQTDIELNPGNGGRSFNNHFSTRSLNDDGSWKSIAKQKNSSADISPTAGQMPRWVGLAYASKLFRNTSGEVKSSRS